MSDPTLHEMAISLLITGLRTGNQGMLNAASLVSGSLARDESDS